MNTSSKKGQLGTIELLMVLLVLGILLGIGLFVYFQYFRADLEQSAEELEEQESNTLLAYALNMPELECSRAAATKNCLDAGKLLAAQTVMSDAENRATYVEIFGFRNIIVDVVYPQTTNQTCTSSTYPDCAHYILFSNKPTNPNGLAKYSVITPLYYPDSKQVKVGRLILEVYE